MARHDTDRRRFIVATIVTLLALPALWWANQQDDSGAPSVASVGVDVGGNASTAGPATPDDDDPVTPEPVFLDGPATGNGGVGDIAVPAPPDSLPVTGIASYSSGVTNVQTCFAKAFPSGVRITVVNLDNNRSIGCVVTRATDLQRTDLVLSTAAYLTLADLTDAPIPVEMRQ